MQRNGGKQQNGKDQRSLQEIQRLKSFGNYTNFIQDEKTKCNKYADELAKMELKWKEQVKIAENIKLELAEVVDNYKVSLIFI